MKVNSLIAIAGLSISNLYAGNPDPTGLLIDICNTSDEDDDYICVTDGAATAPYVETTITLKPAGPKWHDITLEAVDGSLKFEATFTDEAGVEKTESGETITVELQCGESLIVKVWGLQKSTAVDKTKIKGTVDTGLTKEEDMTVFEGVKFEFDGNFYSNCDTRDLVRRPWDGRADAKPNSKFDPNIIGSPGFRTGVFGLEACRTTLIPPITVVKVTSNFSPFNQIDAWIGRPVTPPLAPPTAAEIATFKAAVDQDSSFGYSSAVSFEMGDNSQIPSYKPWTSPYKVIIKAVYGKDPEIILKKDPLNGSALKIKKGLWENRNNQNMYVPDGFEFFRTPEIHIGNYLVFKNTNPLKDTAISPTNPPAGGTPIVPIVLQNVRDLITNLSATNYPSFQELITTYKNSQRAEAHTNAYVKWENTDLGISRGSQSGSLAADCILYDKNKKMIDYRVSWGCTSFMDLESRGQLANGLVEPK